jgi:hypothetical protein
VAAAVASVPNDAEASAPRTDPVEAESDASAVESHTAQAAKSGRIQEPRAAKARLGGRQARLLTLDDIDLEEQKINKELAMLS